MNSPATRIDLVPTPTVVSTGNSNSRRKKSRESRLRMTTPVAIAAVNLHKSYQTGNVEVPVLRGTDVAIHESEFVAIIGQSGSGKSTLLHLLGTLDKPDEGEVHIGNQCVNTMRSTERDRLRNQEIGLIFQFYHLLPELTALENVMVPHMIGEGLFGYFKHRGRYLRRAKELLEKVGLEHRMNHRPRQMSGGEMQRAAIARALVARPSLLLADEPTGNLDRKNGDEVMKALLTLREQENLTIVMVTHDEEIAKKADRVIHLVEGRVKN